MEIIWWMFCWAIMVYLVGRVAFQEGRKSKWEEISREYICIHKTVFITHSTQKEVKKTLDKKVKKRYNKASYKKVKP